MSFWARASSCAPATLISSRTRRSRCSPLPRAVFEYHLDTVTSRKQEYRFEHFAASWLKGDLPQPSCSDRTYGGGDSKVDAETYPVADRLRSVVDRFSGSGTERWAYAFSAKRSGDLR